MSTCTPGFDYTDVRQDDLDIREWVAKNIPQTPCFAASRQMARTQAQWDAYVKMLKDHLLAFKAQAKSDEEIELGAFHESHRLCEFDDEGNLVPEWRPRLLN